MPLQWGNLVFQAEEQASLVTLARESREPVAGTVGAARLQYLCQREMWTHSLTWLPQQQASVVVQQALEVLQKVWEAAQKAWEVAQKVWEVAQKAWEAA